MPTQETTPLRATQTAWYFVELLLDGVWIPHARLARLEQAEGLAATFTCVGYRTRVIVKPIRRRR